MMTLDLRDPRCFAASSANPYVQLAVEASLQSDATQRRELLNALQSELQRALAAGRDDLVSHAVTDIVSPRSARLLWEGVDRALNTPGDSSGALAARVFAIPLVLVTGGSAEAVVPGTLPDVRSIAKVLETHGALGPARNFGVNQALCSDASLAGFSPSRLYTLLRALEAGQADNWPDLVPAPIELDSNAESVHLRFVSGIVVTPAQAPSFSETAGDIGSWGMPLSRELIGQLGQPDLSLLPLPRPPSGLLQAVHAGRRAREEIALQVFASRVLRRLRGITGEPRAELMPRVPAAIRVRFVASAQIDVAEEHDFELDPLDDLGEIVDTIAHLLDACRVGDVRIVDPPPEA